MMSVLDTHSLTRTQRRKIHTRERLKAAALELLYEAGYAALTIKAITERADLGYGTFYLYFEDKDEIVWEVMRELMEAQGAASDVEALRHPSPIREYVSWRNMFTYTAHNKEGFMALFGSRGSARLIKELHDYLVKVHLENLMQAKYAAFHDLPLDFMAQFMTGALIRSLTWWVESGSDYTPTQMANMLFEMVYRQSPPEV